MEGRAYRVAVTEAGRELSAQRSRETRYAGPMPVPLSLYHAVVRNQRPDVRLDQDMLTRSFSDLVIAPDLIDQLGPAIHGEGAMFLYGPPGTGKSSIAERVVRAYQDEVLVPHVSRWTARSSRCSIRRCMTLWPSSHLVGPTLGALPAAGGRHRR